MQFEQKSKLLIIKRTKEENGNILPSIYNLINSIPEEQIFNQEYLLRHPRVIVNRTLKRVYTSFENILSLIIRIEKDTLLIENFKDYNFDSLSKAIMELMESINSFIEDCQHIFKSTTPPSYTISKINENFVSKWLKKAKHPTQKIFFDSIKEYKEEIAYFINNYKHEHGRIDIIPGHYQDNITLGYTMKFIGETPDGNIEILDLNKVKTLRLDIAYHFYQFYKISEIFTKELINAQKIFHGIDITISKFDTDEFNVSKIVEKIQFRDLLIFPNNELFLPKVQINSTSSSLELEHPFGITEKNTKHIKLLKIKDKPFPENALIAIPTARTIKILESFLNGKREADNKLELSLDDPNCFLKIFLTYTNYKKSHTYIELNYDNLFKVKSFTNIRMPIQFESGIESKLHVKIFDVDYLGIKMTKKE